MLQLIAEGLTNQVSAKYLFLARNSVKSHTHNIYAKLDVSSRTQPFVKAKSLGIILSS